MTALQQCLEWARTGFRGVSVHRYMTDGREPIFWVDLWDHDSDPVRNAFGYGESQEEAARAALASASELGMLDPFVTAGAA